MYTVLIKLALYSQLGTAFSAILSINIMYIGYYVYRNFVYLMTFNGNDHHGKESRKTSTV